MPHEIRHFFARRHVAAEARQRLGERSHINIHFVFQSEVAGRPASAFADDAETVRVVKINGEGAVKRRIMDMGITKGIQIYIRKVAPLGDPVEITVRGYELSLRKADAEMIAVE